MRQLNLKINGLTKNRTNVDDCCDRTKAMRNVQRQTKACKQMTATANIQHWEFSMKSKNSANLPYSDVYTLEKVLNGCGSQ